MKNLKDLTQYRLDNEIKDPPKESTEPFIKSIELSYNQFLNMIYAALTDENAFSVSINETGVKSIHIILVADKKYDNISLHDQNMFLHNVKIKEIFNRLGYNIDLHIISNIIYTYITINTTYIASDLDIGCLSLLKNRLDEIFESIYEINKEHSLEIAKKNIHEYNSGEIISDIANIIENGFVKISYHYYNRLNLSIYKVNAYTAYDEIRKVQTYFSTKCDINCKIRIMDRSSSRFDGIPIQVYIITISDISDQYKALTKSIDNIFASDSAFMTSILDRKDVNYNADELLKYIENAIKNKNYYYSNLNNKKRLVMIIPEKRNPNYGDKCRCICPYDEIEKVHDILYSCMGDVDITIHIPSDQSDYDDCEQDYTIFYVSIMLDEDNVND